MDLSICISTKFPGSTDGGWSMDHTLRTTGLGYRTVSVLYMTSIQI